MEKIKALEKIIQGEKIDEKEIENINDNIKELKNKKREIERQIDELETKLQGVKNKHHSDNAWKSTVNISSLLNLAYQHKPYTIISPTNVVLKLTDIFDRLDIPYKTEIPKFVTETRQEQSMMCIYPPKYYEVSERFLVYGSTKMKITDDNWSVLIIELKF